jgi:putative two-component system response regulator
MKEHEIVKMENEIPLTTLYEETAGATFQDGLTGLFNHGFFQLILDREIKRSERQGKPFTLALVDVRGFKRYNLKHGYPAGDRLLKAVADLLRENIRNIDWAARFSGDIFALLLVDASVEDARNAAERIQTAVMRRFSDSIALCIGLIGFPHDALAQADILNLAREALNQAKIQGGDKIHFYEPHHLVVSQGISTILLVDDDLRNLKLLEAFLSALPYEILKANSGEEALDLVQKKEIDLILLDVMMPGINGYEVCRRLKTQENTRLVPIVLITALDDLDSRVKGMESGADDFISKPVNRIEILARTKSLIKNKKLNNSLTNIENVLFSLANAVEAKDHYTQGHTTRVAGLAMTLGRKIGLEEKDMEALRVGGMLHDIGKIGIPESILNKPGPLDDSEWELMRQHSDIGYNICRPLGKTLGLALEVIRHHHEKLDRSGYPDALGAQHLSMATRIMAIVDIYDALTTDRPYRRAFSREEALQIIKKEAEAGKLDMGVVNVLFTLV